MLFDIVHTRRRKRNRRRNGHRVTSGFERGSRFRVVSFSDPYSHLAQKLSRMGLVKGAEIEITNVAPMGDPIEIKSRGYNLSLRLNELQMMNLTPI